MAFLRRLIRLRAIQHGLFGGSRFWMTVLGLQTGWRILRRLTSPTPSTLMTEELKPGETLVVAHGRAPSP